jgi:hypothetical protein
VKLGSIKKSQCDTHSYEIIWSLCGSTIMI